jgi:hypothetical protein
MCGKVTVVCNNYFVIIKFQDKSKTGDIEMKTKIEDDKLKSIVKDSLIEMLHENREEMYELVTEAIEEVSLGKAIERGRKNKFVEEYQIIKLLEG